VSPSIPVAEATVERIGEWMSGLWNKPLSSHANDTTMPAVQEIRHAQA
jgi:simple sugar transport system ATP-binding protein